MTHDDATKLLPLLAVSELDEELRAAVTQHVAACADCAAELRDLTAVCDLLRDAMHVPAEPRLALDPARRSALLAAAVPELSEPAPTADTASPKVDPVGSEESDLASATPVASAEKVTDKLTVSDKPRKTASPTPTKSGATVPSRLTSLHRRRPKGGGAQRLVVTLAALFVVGLGLALVAGLTLGPSPYRLPKSAPDQIVMGASPQSEMDSGFASEEVYESLGYDGEPAPTEAPPKADKHVSNMNSNIILKTMDLSDDDVLTSVTEVTRNNYEATPPNRLTLGDRVMNEVESVSRTGGRVVSSGQANERPSSTTFADSNSNAPTPSAPVPKPVTAPAPTTPAQAAPSSGTAQNGLKDDQEVAGSVTVHYDEKSNHPSNQWMNSLFIDGHAEGAKPDRSKQWDSGDGGAGGGGRGNLIAEKKREVATTGGREDARRSDRDQSEAGPTATSGKLVADVPDMPAVPGATHPLVIDGLVAARSSGTADRTEAPVDLSDAGYVKGALADYAIDDVEDIPQSEEARADTRDRQLAAGAPSGSGLSNDLYNSLSPTANKRREDLSSQIHVTAKFVEVTPELLRSLGFDTSGNLLPQGEKAGDTGAAKAAEVAEAANPGEARASDTLRRKLKEIQLPKIKFDEAPVSDVVRYLQKRSAQLDVVNGTGIDILVIGDGRSSEASKELAKNAVSGDTFNIDDFADISAPRDLSDIPAPLIQEASVGSIITMEFDDIPLGEAIRYLCQGANPKLSYRIDGDRVLIFPEGTDPNQVPQLTREAVERAATEHRAAAILATLPDGTSRVPHQVTGGETVEDIAMMYGADPDWVAAANPQLMNGGQLEPGTTIQVPMPPVVERYAPSQEAEGLPPAPKKTAPPVNPFVMTAADRLSTFALEADTASYTLSRRYIQSGYCPPKAVVRMEEFINSFDYNYPTQAENTFNIYASAAQSPFRPDLTLLKVGVKAKVVGRDGRKPSHLIFVVDASGSMATDDRLPLVKHALSLLLGQLDGSDRVSIVTYGTQGTLLREATSLEQRPDLVRTIQGIQPGTSTNMVEGIELAYNVAQRNYQAGEINRIILCSDGIANVGPQTAEQILELVSNRRKQGITFTSVGVGAGAYDDRMLEQLANRGDGNYVYIDSREQARKVFVDEFSATLQTVAKDAKIQVDFDPKRVRRYRLIGYENRDIADADFRNDSVDAGEINSGQSATALYELELLPAPAGEAPGDLGTVFVRYQNVDTEQVEEIATRLTADLGPRVSQPSTDPYFLLAASAAEFAERLRGSEYAQNTSLPDIQRVLSKVLAQLPGNTQATGLQELTIRADGLPEYR